MLPAQISLSAPQLLLENYVPALSCQEFLHALPVIAHITASRRFRQYGSIQPKNGIVYDKNMEYNIVFENMLTEIGEHISILEM